MSEYQYVAFRAIDRPVSQDNLAYMRRQSSRAEITPWSFENEYHYGDFRGNPIEMLRRGYDIHLHYANFGIRRLMIGLPRGLPEPGSIRPYSVKKSLEFLSNGKGPGGCLSIDPYYEPGELEELLEVDDLLDRLVPLRAELLDGDIRPLYLAHLAVAADGNHDPEETQEAPVPAGLGNLTDAQQALAELYGLGAELIAAAAMESRPLPNGESRDLESRYEAWIRGQPESVRNAWLGELMEKTDSQVRAEMLSRFRKDLNLPTWPTSPPSRTIAQLHELATEAARTARQKAAANAARERAKRLAKMAADPSPTLRETERLVADRGTVSYQQAAELLADLREALAETGSAGLAEKQAQKLRAANPKLSRLTSELRRQGFLPK